MKKILLAFASVLMAFAASAQGGKTFTYCEYTTNPSVNASWDLIDYRVLDEENKTCVVIGGTKRPPVDPTDPNSYPNRYITVNLKIPSVARDVEGTEYTVVAIADESFRLFDYVKTVSIPSSVTEIGINAFYGCSAITKLSLNEGLEKIGNSAFAQCREITKVELPATVTEIGTRTFFGCSKLENVVLSESVKTIPEAAFERCEKLTAINLDHVELIEEGAFRDCHNRLLQGSRFSPNLREIGHEGFKIEPGQYESDGYSPITVSTLTPPTIYDDTFAGHDALHVSVPAVAEAAYKADSQWGRYTILRISEKGKKFEYRGLKYQVTDKSYTVDCIGYSDYSRVDNVTMYETVKDEDDVEYTVTAIGSYAFKNSDLLRHIQFPATLETIGVSAFEGCSQIRTVQFYDGSSAMNLIDDRAFFGCSRLSPCAFPAGLAEIGTSAFEGCSSMDYVVIPPSVTAIGESAFSNCEIKKSIVPDRRYNGSVPSRYAVRYDPEDVSIDGNSQFVYNADHTTLLSAPLLLSGPYFADSGLTSIGNQAFAGCISLTGIETYDSEITHIGIEAFKDCYTLNNTNFLKSVTSIGDKAFVDCHMLASVELSDDLAEFGTGVFSNCFGLESAKLSSGLTKIPAATFYSCNSLKSVEIPAGVTEIGETAFYYCIGLTGLTLPEGLQTIGDQAFSNCHGITGIVIPETVTSIGEEAFYRCKGLTVIDVPASITNISEGLFANCEALRTVTLHEGLTTIGKYAFNGCTSLETLELPSTVRSLDSGVINGCAAMNSITALPSTPPAGVEGVFTAANYKVPLFVNPEYVSAYKRAPYWKNFNIYGIGDDPASIPSMDIEGLPTESEGATYATLRASLPLVWSSDNEEVALVSNNGVVTAVAPGEADITAAVHGHPELTDTMHVTVLREIGTGAPEVRSDAMSVKVRSGVIVVENVAEGETVSVYTPDGILHASVVSDGGTISVPVVSGKIYIVAAGRLALKVVAR